ncbi:hypothetical protein KKH23_03440 [Patescibacteria group bacterium]|nr:hypothetical protein [Patescibacteria group bacterium]MBU0776846.1 hypothetical protein [Patescibacteria group bacterium]MBU0846219.1 hypothetical protein [Patescibacteria group bacterium]MBU0922622.1 hypothetical protein [Patescibacteria group bacterium]MBU1066673.1 hypothetical protein [Patescibacteria group bacterium]
MNSKRKENKGTLVWDAGASRLLQESARNAGYKIIAVNPLDKTSGDRLIASKYAQGRFPVVTSDRTAWKEMLVEKGATAIVCIKNPRKEDFGIIKKKLESFLKKSTANSLRGYIWTVSVTKVDKKKI